MKKRTAGFVAVFSCFLLLNGCGTPAVPIPAATESAAESPVTTEPAAESPVIIEPAAESSSATESLSVTESAPESEDSGAELEPEGENEQIPFEEGQLYAAAYLGYQKIDDWDYYAERYLDETQPPTYYISSGDFYLIIPRYPGMSLSLFAKDMETGENILNCEEPDCGPFIVQCNISDIFADAVIQLSYKETTIEYSPCLSGENGSLVAGEYGLDITKPGAIAVND